MNRDIAARCGSSHHIGACFYHVGCYTICTTIQLLNAFNADNVRSCAADMCAHVIEEVRSIDDMRLFSGIFDNCLSLRHNGSQHDINCCAYRDNIEIYILSVHMSGFSDNIPVLNTYIGANSLKAFYMLVNRSAADVTASRNRNFSLSVFSEKRSQKII